MRANTTNWIEARLGRFTGSGMYRLMTQPKSKSAKDNGELSEGAKTYCMEKAAELLTGQPRDDFFSQATDHGHNYEFEAVSLYELERDASVTPGTMIDYTPDICGTPDGLVGSDGLIEVKCPFNPVYHLRHVLMSDLKTGHAEYYWQVQFYMMITGRQWCDFISYCPSFQGAAKMTVKRIFRNEQDIQDMRQALSSAIAYRNQIIDTCTLG